MNKVEKRVVYVRRPAKAGDPPLSTLVLPNGTTVRRVDENLHRRALANAAQRYRERLNAE